jgi:hypothetical protein
LLDLRLNLSSPRAQLLRSAFEVYGEVTDAFVAYNGRSSRGFGYVTFKNDDSAAKAVRVAVPPCRACLVLPAARSSPCAFHVACVLAAQRPNPQHSEIAADVCVCVCACVYAPVCVRVWRARWLLLRRSKPSRRTAC